MDYLVFVPADKTSFTHVGRDKVTAVLQTPYSNAFSSMETFVILCTFRSWICSNKQLLVEYDELSENSGRSLGHLTAYSQTATVEFGKYLSAK